MATIWRHIRSCLSVACHLSCLSRQQASTQYMQSALLSICLPRSDNFYLIKVVVIFDKFSHGNCENVYTFQIRTIGLTICILFVYASAFLFIKLFPIFLEIIGLNGCLVIYMIGSVMGAFFVMCALDETKGRSLDTLKSTGSKWTQKRFPTNYL